MAAVALDAGIAGAQACGNGRKLEEFAFGQVLNEGEVGGEEVVVREAGDGAPEHLVEDVVDHLLIEVGDGEELDFDGAAVAVGVTDGGDEWANGGSDAELFAEFALQGLLGGLTGLDFAAGELPLEAHGLLGTALADEDLTVWAFATQNEGGDHLAEGFDCEWGPTTVQFAYGLFHVACTV
jgi:hypothetical protein